MKFHYDKETDSLYIDFIDGPASITSSSLTIASPTSTRRDGWSDWISSMPASHPTSAISLSMA